MEAIKNLEKVIAILKTYQPLGLRLPKSLSLGGQMRLLLNEKEAQDSIGPFLNKVIELAELYSYDQGKKILDALASEIADYNIRAVRAHNKEQKAVSADVEIKYHISEEKETGIKYELFISQLVSKEDLESKLRIHLHNALFIKTVEKMSRLSLTFGGDKNFFREHEKSTDILVNTLSTYFPSYINIPYQLIPYQLLVAERYEFDQRKEDIFSRLRKNYCYLLDKITLSVKRVSEDGSDRYKGIDRIINCINICLALTDQKSDFSIWDLSSILKSQLTEVRDEDFVLRKDEKIEFVDSSLGIDYDKLLKFRELGLYQSSEENQREKFDREVKQLYQKIIEVNLAQLDLVSKGIEQIRDEGSPIRKKLEELQVKITFNLFFKDNYNLLRTTEEREKFASKVNYLSDVILENYSNIQTRSRRNLLRNLLEVDWKKGLFRDRLKNTYLFAELVRKLTDGKIDYNKDDLVKLQGVIIDLLLDKYIADNELLISDIVKNILISMTQLSDMQLRDRLFQTFCAYFLDFDSSLVNCIDLDDIIKTCLLSAEEIEKLEKLFKLHKKGLEKLEMTEDLLAYWQPKLSSSEYSIKDFMVDKVDKLSKDFSKKIAYPDLSVFSSMVLEREINEAYFYGLLVLELYGIDIDEEAIKSRFLEYLLIRRFEFFKTLKIYENFHIIDRNFRINKSTLNVIKSVLKACFDTVKEISWEDALLLDAFELTEENTSHIKDWDKLMSYRLLKTEYQDLDNINIKEFYIQEIIKRFNEDREDVEDPIRTYIEDINSSLLNSDKIGHYEKQLLHKKITNILYDYYGIR